MFVTHEFEGSAAGGGRGPTAADLAAIEAEWPAIAAELEALDQEIRALGVHSVLSEVAVRRARRVGRAQLRSLPTAPVRVAPAADGSLGSEAA